MYQLGQRIDVHVTRTATEPNFDRACESAQRIALHMFGWDDDGYLTLVKGYERSTDCLMLEFKKYTMRGRDQIYSFVAWVERNQENT